MKETDIDYIYNQSLEIVDQAEPAILVDVNRQTLALIMTTFYLSSDISKEQTIRLFNFGTLIISGLNMSLILDKGLATRFSQKTPIIQYEELQADLYNILSYIDFCYQRLE